MSNIVFDTAMSNASMMVMGYKSILKKKIDEVCSKIQFDDEEITWIIFEPSKNKKGKMNLFNDMRIGFSGKDYGFCSVEENKICISILAIMKDNNSSKSNIIREQSRNGEKAVEKDFLADVILDEITHIQTKCNHNDSRYERKLRENKEKYYKNYRLK